MRMTAHLFLLSSIFLLAPAATSQSTPEPVSFSSDNAVCQIAEFKGRDIAPHCNGEVIFFPNHNLIIVGIGPKNLESYLAFNGDITRGFYDAANKNDYPLFLQVNRIQFMETTISSEGIVGMCFLAATQKHQSVMIRCYARQGGALQANLLIHINGLLE